MRQAVVHTRQKLNTSERRTSRFWACRVPACVTKPKLKTMIHCAWPRPVWPSSKGDTDIVKLLNYCVSKVGASITRKSNVYGAKKGSDGTVRQNELETGRAVLYPRRMTKRSPFRYFKSSPEIIRLAVMLYVRFALKFNRTTALTEWRQLLSA